MIPLQALIRCWSRTILRSRISYVTTRPTATSSAVSTYYSYDAHGHVTSLVQDLPGLGLKRLDYDYDLISGNVHHVIYQYGAPDQFYHRFGYDGDNRLMTVETSHDGYLWTQDAEYFYYAHGPLARVELGDYNVQGLDYYYSLQGWLKGVNMPGGGDDPGGDGVYSGKDAFAFVLGYHQDDFRAIGGGVQLPGSRDGLWARYSESQGTSGLYNGNISWMGTDLPSLGGASASEGPGYQAMLYGYDQLHRLMRSESLGDYSAGIGFAPRTGESASYDTRYSYDGNGNLQSLERYDGGAELRDDFRYTYASGKNQLLNYSQEYGTEVPDGKVYSSGPIVHDGTVYHNITLIDSAELTSGSTAAMTVTGSFEMGPGTVLRSGSTFKLYFDPTAKNTLQPGESPYQYEYDAIGNLVRDHGDQVRIAWNTYGKVSSVTHDNGDVTSYRYDGSGNRVEKRVTTAGKTVMTYHVRDANGQVMATYRHRLAPRGGSPSGPPGPPGGDPDGDPDAPVDEDYDRVPVLIEQPILGSSRVGLYLGEVEAGKQTLGHRQYELSNHLGNVLAVVTDNLEVVEGQMTAKVVHASDYYPFGLDMEGRRHTTETYRYGFNGKEKSEGREWGKSMHYDYGFRIYNPTIAKFLSVDPLTKEYPWYTPYQFAGNKPVRYIDLDGLEEADMMGKSRTSALFVKPDRWQMSISARKYGRTAVERDNPWIYFKNKEQEVGQGMGPFLVGTSIVLVDIFLTKGYLSGLMLISDIGESINATERAYEAKARGDLAGYESYMNASGEYSKSIVYDAAGFGIAKGVRYISIRSAEARALLNSGPKDYNAWVAGNNKHAMIIMEHPDVSDLIIVHQVHGKGKMIPNRFSPVRFGSGDLSMKKLRKLPEFGKSTEIATIPISEKQARSMIIKSKGMAGHNLYMTGMQDCVTCVKKVLGAGGIEVNPLVKTPKGLVEYMKKLDR